MCSVGEGTLHSSISKPKEAAKCSIVVDTSLATHASLSSGICLSSACLHCRPHSHPYAAVRHLFSHTKTTSMDHAMEQVWLQI